MTCTDQIRVSLVSCSAKHVDIPLGQEVNQVRYDGEIMPSFDMMGFIKTLTGKFMKIGG